MTTEVTVNGNLVYRDDAYSHRWLDAVGPDVCKFLEEFTYTPFTGANAPSGYTATLVNTSTAALINGSPLGAILITTDTTDGDGLECQALGESFYLAARYPLYIGCQFAVDDADKTAAILGLAIQDTSAIAGATDGLYFRTAKDSALLYLVAEKDSAETAIAVATLVDATTVTAELLYQGSTATAYINGVQVATLEDSDVNWPDDEYLAPIFGAMTNTGAHTLTVNWLRCIQVQTT
jgi:hypothetical protein